MIPKDEMPQDEQMELTDAEPQEPAVDADVPAVEDAAEEPGVALQEAPEEAVKRLEHELHGAKDQYLRMAAEYENFRRRTAKERLELRVRAQADMIGKLLDAFDDLRRVAHVDPDQSTVTDVLDGVQLVERKILKELEAAGLERITGEGEPFDPNYQEAVGMLPTTDPEKDHTVADVFQVGYRIGAILLRPARVRVHTLEQTQAEGDGTE